MKVSQTDRHRQTEWLDVLPMSYKSCGVTVPVPGGGRAVHWITRLCLLSAQVSLGTSRWSIKKKWMEDRVWRIALGLHSSEVTHWNITRMGIISKKQWCCVGGRLINKNWVYNQLRHWKFNFYHHRKFKKHELMSFKLYAVVKLKFSTPHMVNPILVCHWDMDKFATD